MCKHPRDDDVKGGTMPSEVMKRVLAITSYCGECSSRQIPLGDNSVALSRNDYALLQPKLIHPLRSDPSCRWTSHLMAYSR